MRSVLLIALAAAPLVGCGHSYDKDVPEVAARYAHRNTAKCASWLFSSQTGYEYCASPAIAVVVEPPPKPPEPSPVEGIDPSDTQAMIAAGKTLYGTHCSVCHGDDGMGDGTNFPPLAGTDYIDDPLKHAEIIVKGLNGEIVVNGKTFNNAMAPLGNLSDLEIAAIATFERNSWGNDLGSVTPEQVASVR